MAKAWAAAFLGLAFCASVLGSEQKVLTHENHGILRRFNVSWEERKNVLKIAQDHGLDIWHIGQSFIDVYAPPDAMMWFPKDLQAIPHTSSVQLLPERNSEPQQPLKGWDLSTLNNSTFHERYHPRKEIEDFLQQLVARNPNATSLSTIGLSAHGREIKVLTISKPDGYVHDDDGKRKKKKKRKGPVPEEKFDFVILGAQHAREWIATATSLYLAHSLTINSTSTEPHGLSSLINLYNFHIIPVPNPDGYEYTWKVDRYWYKNRQIVAPHSKCYGLDMNRNWGYKWEGEEVGIPAEPAHPCSHWYPGSRPFESAEVNSIANFISTLHNPIGFIDLRSYGQMLSTPYSYSCKRYPKDAEDQAEAAYGAIHAIKDIHDVHYQEGRLCDNLYEASGNAVDWMYQRAGIKYSFVAHLRDTGTHGFSLPEKWIRPVGEETAGMIRYLAKFIAGKYNRKF